MEHWSVLKFGGTSVARPGHWETIARLAAERLGEGRRVLLVCSALAGVTNDLEALAGGDQAAEPAIAELLGRHRALAQGLGVDAAALIDDAGVAIGAALSAYREDSHPAHLAELLAQGELLSTRLGLRYLEQRLEAGWVDARGALTALPEPQPDSRRAWLSARCEARPDPELQQDWSRRAPLLITQGFIARHAEGATALLGRGGSDTSAALLAAALSAKVVEIWTDVPGLFTTDPRLEPSALLIRELDYPEALELAASGARVVHPRAIRAAADAGVAMRVRDITRPGLDGTLISAQARPGAAGVKAVTCQPGMLVLLLENLDSRQQVGFLAGVFAAISRAGVSVDLVATSETTTTLAINAAANHLDPPATEALVAELSAHCRVELHAGCSCVNLVGRAARTALSRMGRTARLFDERPLLMLSQSANDMSISLLVPEADATGLLRSLHRELIVEQAGEGGAFGPAWDALGDGT